MMRRVGIAALAVLGGCTMRDSAATDSARVADSVRAADSVAAADAIAPAAGAADSIGIVPPPADASGNLTGETRNRGGAIKKDSIIGRDSAFGPIGTMDEKGNVRPIKK